MSKAKVKVKKLNVGKASPSPLNPKMMAAWNQGFSQGVKNQREADIKFMIEFIGSLDEIAGIGEKTSHKIIDNFKSRFGKE